MEECDSWVTIHINIFLCQLRIRIILFLHVAYSPDLEASHYYLFRLIYRIKNLGMSFMFKASSKNLLYRSQSFYQYRMNKLLQRWHKIIERKRKYLENVNVNRNKKKSQVTFAEKVCWKYFGLSYFQKFGRIIRQHIFPGIQKTYWFKTKQKKLLFGYFWYVKQDEYSTVLHLISVCEHEYLLP